ncbi:hypothetical protein BS47DRAFT_1489179 [Hydnum rufescens UP504]|uniref:CCL2-like lectin domain-containing protein n=1 Tax=Hydnum rufescens UP504 TaxID=1448309 RepID=A0A9P6AL43_9AGAM|nr:hypothetical protein BS47DRAFT_1489179 [Hydnum rufescens UP504]
MPPYIILSRVLSANGEELAVQYNAAGNFTLAAFNMINIPDAQHWVLNLNPVPIGDTPMIPVPAVDRQAAPGGAGGTFIQGPQLIHPHPWTFDVPGALDLSWIQGPDGNVWGSGAAEPSEAVSLTDFLVRRSLLEPKAPTPQDRDGLCGRLGSTHRPECAVSKYVAS